MVDQGSGRKACELLLLGLGMHVGVKCDILWQIALTENVGDLQLRG